ncbi:MAG: PPC domain-containing protein, partial [Gemmatimonadetes bacterium]|nr:PPC domain-containing protein [Gemmatimonadota bacterium]
RRLTWLEPARGRLSGAEATIRDGQPVQAWALQALAGETATIRLESDDFDAYLFVYGPGMSEAMTDDDSGGGLNAELTVLFLETGTYTIGASALSAGSTGSYSLTVSEPIDMNDLSTGGRMLMRGSNARGMLTAADPVIDGKPVQAWAFEARAGDFVTVELMSDDFDSYLFVVGPGLPEPLSDDDGGEGLNSRLDISFPADGVYRVVASSLGGATGMFTLTVR